eukprot:TRINITY_DN82273_c0_g1_i1.p1 TRINITY_DN82273_c0_g1~~TRINITY_DN82273_c0_g1_i1.p1  ORF type:complete len:459 (+),score=41.81 TRINITY_DN82273_c0_g1_i1:112-1488(+)
MNFGSSLVFMCPVCFFNPYHWRCGDVSMKWVKLSCFLLLTAVLLSAYLREQMARQTARPADVRAQLDLWRKGSFPGQRDAEQKGDKERSFNETAEHVGEKLDNHSAVAVSGEPSTRPNSEAVWENYQEKQEKAREKRITADHYRLNGCLAAVLFGLPVLGTAPLYNLAVLAASLRQNGVMEPFKLIVPVGTETTEESSQLLSTLRTRYAIDLVWVDGIAKELHESWRVRGGRIALSFNKLFAFDPNVMKGCSSSLLLDTDIFFLAPVPNLFAILSNYSDAYLARKCKDAANCSVKTPISMVDYPYRGCCGQVNAGFMYAPVTSVLFDAGVAMLNEWTITKGTDQQMLERLAHRVGLVHLPHWFAFDQQAEAWMRARCAIRDCSFESVRDRALAFHFKGFKPTEFEQMTADCSVCGWEKRKWTNRKQCMFSCRWARRWRQILASEFSSIQHFPNMSCCD